MKVSRLPRLRLPKVSKSHGQLAVQCAGVLAVLWGVAAWSIPCAFILGGIVAVITVERQEV